MATSRQSPPFSGSSRPENGIGGGGLACRSGESDAVIIAHVMGGPLDPIIEFALPLAIFVGLYFWSTRTGRRRAGRSARGASGRASESWIAYVSRSSRELRALEATLKTGPQDDANAALLRVIQAELQRRSGDRE